MKKYLAEVIGTFTLVLFGCGAAVFAGESLGVLGIAFAFGLAIVAMAYSIGTISGCHVNPAVSLAMLINKRLSVTEFVGYVASQVVGALLGTLTIMAILNFQGVEIVSLGENLFNSLGATGAFFVEVVLTFVFVLVILLVTGKKGNSNLAGVVIGLTLVLVHIVGINLTGTSVNPARSLAPALFTTNANALPELWVFILAPFVGAAIAAVVARVLESEK
ncbi:MAG: MIP/aquaporin family protein [Anaerorhabdus sp.]